MKNREKKVAQGKRGGRKSRKNNSLRVVLFLIQDRFWITFFLSFVVHLYKGRLNQIDNMATEKRETTQNLGDRFLDAKTGNRKRNEPAKNK